MCRRFDITQSTVIDSYNLGMKITYSIGIYINYYHYLYIQSSIVDLFDKELSLMDSYTCYA